MLTAVMRICGDGKDGIGRTLQLGAIIAAKCAPHIMKILMQYGCYNFQ